MLGANSFFVRVIVAAALLALAGSSCGHGSRSNALLEQVSTEMAVQLSERFVRENGYTDAPNDEIKLQLDLESIERADSRAELLKSRRNTLQPKAIGVKSTDDGWGVAFDYVDHPGSCRVVTINKDGTQIRMQHKDGVRDHWLGFDKP